MASEQNLSYLKGHRDGIAALYKALRSEGASAEESAELSGLAAASDGDSDLSTWGLRVTGVLDSPYSGRGIRVAVLGTGMDLTHPDFQGRTIEGRSFVPGQPVQSGYGYTTHLIGTACGPREAAGGPRYGIAWEADIYVGKILSDQGRGQDNWILAGIQWALRKECHVILVYAGADRPPSRAYERIAERCLADGSLVIAAAGLNARRPDDFGQVSMPGNCKSVMAIGGVTPNLDVARFSPRSSSFPGSEIDLVGPAADVYSAFSMPQRYARASGTSRSAAHAAGIAALHAEASGARGHALWQKLVTTARRLPAPSSDVGAGLVQAPRKSPTMK